MNLKTKSKDEKWPNINLYLDPETSHQVAELRAIYSNQGRNYSSLAYVVRDALFYYHQHMTELVGTPSNAKDFMS